MKDEGKRNGYDSNRGEVYRRDTTAAIVSARSWVVQLGVAAIMISATISSFRMNLRHEFAG